MSTIMPEASLLGDKFDAIEQASVRWFMRVNHNDCSVEDTAQFEQWLSARSEHRLKYNAVCSLMEQSREFTDDPAMAEYFQPMLAQNQLGTSISLQQELTVGGRASVGFFTRAMRGSKQMLTQALGYVPVRSFVAITAVFACMVYMYPQMKIEFEKILPSKEPAQVYETGVGEVKTVTLDDGSLLRMNTRTVLTVAFSELQRKITLDQGQASFTVAKNPNKPFVVSTGLGRVTALGTEFDIYKTADKMTISLIEGKIQVGHVLNDAIAPEGAQKHVVPNNESEVIVVEVENDRVSSIALTVKGISPVEHADPDAVIAWRHNKIIFNEQSLSDVLVELNRYSERLIVLQDVIHEEERITAVFPTDIPTALSMIKTHFNLEEISGGSGEIILISNNQSNI